MKRILAGLVAGALFAPAAIAEIDKAKVLLGHKFAEDCEEGFAAFVENVYPVLRENCAGCHGDGGSGPAFIVEDMSTSYFRVKNYVDFGNIPTSKLVIRAGNPHTCPSTICNDETGAEVESAVDDWWNTGENMCETIGSFFTESMVIPELPAEGAGFTKLRFPLASINEAYAEHFFEIDAQKFSEPSGEIPGSYRFRSPRIVGKDKSFEVETVRVLINRKYDVLASNYTYVNAKVGPQELPGRSTDIPYPVLSADRMIVLQDLAEGDEISISFDALAISEPLVCTKAGLFSEKVMPTLEARNCYGCHGGGSEGATGFAPANETFYMGIESAKLCDGFLQRLSMQGPAPSPAVAYPLLGVNGHARIFISGEEVYPYWNPWMDEEIAVYE